MTFYRKYKGINIHRERRLVNNGKKRWFYTIGIVLFPTRKSIVNHIKHDSLMNLPTFAQLTKHDRPIFDQFLSEKTLASE